LFINYLKSFYKTNIIKKKKKKRKKKKDKIKK